MTNWTRSHSAVNALVSELRFAHARITESERVNFATAFHANPCGMAIVRVSDGQFQDVNAGFERQTGFSRDEVVGRTVHELGVWIDPDDVAAVTSGNVGRRPLRQPRGPISRQEWPAVDLRLLGGSHHLSAASRVCSRLAWTSRTANTPKRRRLLCAMSSRTWAA